MTEPTAALENRLVEAYREQLRLYNDAVALVDRVSFDTGHWAGALDGILRAIAAVDAGLAEDKAAWQRSRGEPGAELGTLLEQIAGRLAMLGQIVQGQVAEFEARQARLLPEMDALIQQRRMLSAYGTYGDRHSHVAKAD